MTGVPHQPVELLVAPLSQAHIGLLVTEPDRMRTRYQHALQRVHQAVVNISTASAEIANGHQDLSARTEQTASSTARLTGTVTVGRCCAPGQPMSDYCGRCSCAWRRRG